MGTPTTFRHCILMHWARPESSEISEFKNEPKIERKTFRDEIGVIMDMDIPHGIVLDVLLDAVHLHHTNEAPMAILHSTKGIRCPYCCPSFDDSKLSITRCPTDPMVPLHHVVPRHATIEVVDTLKIQNHPNTRMIPSRSRSSWR